MNVVEIEHLCYTYPGADKPTLRDVDLTIEKGDPSRVGLIAREDAYFMYEKGKESKVSSTKIELVKKELPYDPKDTVARAHVKMSDGYTFTVDLGVKEAVRPMSFLQLWIRALREMFA